MRWIYSLNQVMEATEILEFQILLLYNKRYLEIISLSSKSLKKLAFFIQSILQRP